MVPDQLEVVIQKAKKWKEYYCSRKSRCFPQHMGARMNRKYRRRRNDRSKSMELLLEFSPLLIVMCGSLFVIAIIARELLHHHHS